MSKIITGWHNPASRDRTAWMLKTNWPTDSETQALKVKTSQLSHWVITRRHRIPRLWADLYLAGLPSLGATAGETPGDETRSAKAAADEKKQTKKHSPQFCHSIHELFLGEFALSGGVELPRDDQHSDAGRVQWEVVTKLLDPINADLIFILGIYRNKELGYFLRFGENKSTTMWSFLHQPDIVKQRLTKSFALLCHNQNLRPTQRSNINMQWNVEIQTMRKLFNK